MQESDNSRAVAKLLAGRLIERRDVKATQHSSGAYTPVKRNKNSDEYLPFTLDDLVAHVEGSRTFGHYLTKPEGNTCRVVAFDIDLEKKATSRVPFGDATADIEPRAIWEGPTCDWKRLLATDLQTLTYGLATCMHELLDTQVIAAYSGNKGMHVLGLLDPGTPAEDARILGRQVLDQFGAGLAKGKNFFKAEAFPTLSIELFPKQEEVDAGGFGNLMRLPLGVNQKSGKPGFFLSMKDLPRKTVIDHDVVATLTEGSIR